MKIAKDRFEIDLNPCILWQYNDAHNLQKLLQGEYDFFDFCTNQFWKNYIEFIFNVASASRTGLERWARLIGVQTHYATKVNTATETSASGFVTVERHEKGTEFRSMSDDFLRRAIIARFFLLDSNGSCDAINRYLKMLYGTVAVPSDTSTISVFDGMKWNTVNKSRLNYVGQSPSARPEDGDWYSNGKYCFVRASSKWIAVNNPVLVNKGNEEPYDPKAGWYYINGATLDAKVYSSDVAFARPFTWKLNTRTMTGTYVGNDGNGEYIVRPMEIYYWMRNNTSEPQSGDYYMTGNVATIRVGTGTVDVTGTPRPAVAGLMRVVSGKVQIFDGSSWVNTNASSLTLVENGWWYKKSASVTSVFFGGEWHDIAASSLSKVAAGWWYSVPDTLMKMLFDGSSWHTVSALGLDQLSSGQYYVRNGVTYVWDSSLSNFREFAGLLSAVAKGAYYYDPSTGLTRVYGGSSWLSVHGAMKPAAVGEYYVENPTSASPSVRVFTGSGFTTIAGTSKLTFKGTAPATADVAAGDWYTKSGDTFVYDGESWIELDGVSALVQITKPGSSVKGTYYTEDGDTHVFTGQYWTVFYGTLAVPRAGDFRSASSLGGDSTAVYDGSKWIAVKVPAPTPFPVGAHYRTTGEGGDVTSVFGGSRWVDFATGTLNDIGGKPEEPTEPEEGGEEGGEPQTFNIGDYYVDGGRTFIYDGTDWIAFDTNSLSEVATGGYWTRSVAGGEVTSLYDGENFVEIASALTDRSADESTGANYSVGGDFYFKSEYTWEKVVGMTALTPIDAPTEPVAGQYYMDVAGEEQFAMLYDGLSWREVLADGLNYRGEGEPTAEKSAGDYYVQGATVNVYDGRIWVGVDALTLKDCGSERPASPNTGDYYSDGTNTYLWMGDSWLMLAVSRLTFKGNARPSGIYSVGDWYVTGQTFIWDAANNIYVGISAPIDEENSRFSNGDYYQSGNAVNIYDDQQGGESPWLVFSDGLTAATEGTWWSENGRSYVYDGSRGIEFANSLAVIQAGDYGRVGSSTFVCKSSSGTHVEWVEVAATSLVQKSAPSAGWWYDYSDGTARLYDGSTWVMVGGALVQKSAPSAGWWYDSGNSLMTVYIASSGWSDFPSGVGNAEGGAWFVSGSDVVILDGATSTWKTLNGVTTLKSISSDSAYESVANDKYYEDVSGADAVELARDSLRKSGFSDEEIYTLTLLANQRVFLPAPAGVRINGLDDDIPLRRRASVYFSFELEALEPSNENTKFSDEISIGSLDHTKFAEAEGT